jgi:hypothetical protein
MSRFYSSNRPVKLIRNIVFLFRVAFIRQRYQVFEKVRAFFFAEISQRIDI